MSKRRKPSRRSSVTLRSPAPAGLADHMVQQPGPSWPWPWRACSALAWGRHRLAPTRFLAPAPTRGQRPRRQALADAHGAAAAGRHASTPARATSPAFFLPTLVHSQGPPCASPILPTPSSRATSSPRICASTCKPVSAAPGSAGSASRPWTPGLVTTSKSPSAIVGTATASSRAGWQRPGFRAPGQPGLGSKRRPRRCALQGLCGPPA